MKLKQVALAAALALIAASTFAKDVYVHGYTRRDGTYVEPHHRTSPDGRLNNNWSTEGNVNPYTGKQGTVDPYRTPSHPTPMPYYYGNPYGTTR